MAATASSAYNPFRSETDPIVPAPGNPASLHATEASNLQPTVSAPANATTSASGSTMIQCLNVFSAAGLTSNEVAAELRSDLEHGLPTAEAARRIQFNGYNEFDLAEKESLFGKYVEQFKNPLILLLLASAAVSVLMKQFDDALSITIAVVIVVSVGFVQEYRSEKTLEQLNKLVPPTAHCIRDGRSVQFLARELVPGDLVTLTVGDRVPADVRLIETIDLQINESSFTGETEPRHKHAMPLQAPSASGIEHLDNIAFMGTLICSGRGQGIVVGTGANSKFGEVFTMMNSVEAPKTPLQNSMDVLGTQLSIYSFAVIGVIFVIGLIQGRAVLDMFTIGVSLAVAAIPEGLPVVVAVTLAIGVMRMGHRQVVVKKLSAVETLGCVTVICSDKTGTLTKNEMTATVVLAADGSRADVSGVGYDATDGICTTEMGEKVSGHSHPGVTRVIEIGCVCNNAQIINNTVLGQPTEGALMVLAMKTQLDISRSYFKRVKEMPFSSETKWMAVQVEPTNRPGAHEVMVKGALDKVIDMCHGYYAHGGHIMPISDAQKEQILNHGRGLGTAGLRVIAVASGKDMQSLGYAGLVGILDPPRPGCQESVEIIQSAGVAVKMITGDSVETACSIAQRLGIYQPNDSVLSGPQIEAMSDMDLERVISNVVVFYRANPHHKLKIVKALQGIGEVVAMTGDGVNDAAALKTSDIGIAMGISGTDVCKEAADMVLVDDNFLTIRNAIEEGKGIYHNITNFVRFQLSTSVAALSLIALSTLFHFENPLNAMQILWINIIMDGPPAQSLGVEPVDADIIRQKPRDVKQPMITKSLIGSILSSAAIIIVGTMFVFYKEMSADNKITPRDTTMTFTCFVLFDMWNALSCRSSRKLIWEIGLVRNKMFCIAVSASLLCQLAVIYFAPLQRIFQTEALSLFDLVFLTALTSTVFIFNESKKYIELRSIRSLPFFDGSKQNNL
uniref:Calcium-transporting ATPase n=1 Tax=Panagrellus redivivus TaxID=6233 RepID=A0A7E4UZ87_PANRE